MTHQVLPKNASSLDPKIWRAIAGAAVQIPSVNDMVYYFPQGHVEASHPKNLSPQLLSRPITLCTVSDVHYLADTNTDEVFAKIFLQPLNDFNSAVSSRAIHEVDDGEEISSFTKMITHNDFKHASRLYFPKDCATSVFPPLDTFDHSILMTDVHGSTWKFRHVCCTRKHRLTDGWESFVHGKKLVPGDYVVFVKNPRGKLFIGIRRGGSFAKKRRAVLARSCVGSEATRLCLGVRNRVDDEENSDAMAAELAGHGMAFEVDYYPKAGLSGFVLKVEVVHAAMSVTWLRGMKIKMAVETDEYSDGTNWFTGVVSSVNVLKDGPWRGCPWRMLQITWDIRRDGVTPKKKIPTRVFPWQVELISTILDTPIPSKKRIRVGSGVLTDGDGDPFSITGFNNSTMGQFSQAVPGLKSLSTELNVGSSQSGDFSPESQSSLPSFGTDFVRNLNCSSTKPGPVSFQLFGAVIQTEQPVESGSHGTGSSGDDSSKGCNDTEGINNALEDSLTYSKLLDRLDGQCQIASTVEACYL